MLNLYFSVACGCIRSQTGELQGSGLGLHISQNRLLCFVELPAFMEQSLFYSRLLEMKFFDMDLYYQNGLLSLPLQIFQPQSFIKVV